MPYVNIYHEDLELLESIDQILCDGHWDDPDEPDHVENMKRWKQFLEKARVAHRPAKPEPPRRKVGRRG